MIKGILVGLAAILSFEVALRAQRFEQVEYFSDSVLEADDGLLRLLGGSSWAVSTASTVLAAAAVVIVIRDVTLESRKGRVAVAYVDGQELVVRYAGGSYAPSKGYLTSVVEAHRDGAVLELADGFTLVGA